MEKPKKIIEIEDFILKNKPKIMEYEDRVHFSKMKRPQIKFEGGKKEVEKIDQEIQSAENDLKELEENLQGAYESLKSEIVKWEDQELEKLDIEARDLEKEIAQIEKKTSEYKEKLKQLHGGRDVHLMFAGGGGKDWSLGQRLNSINGNRSSRIDDIKRRIRNQIRVDI
ncbi:hypothetical protein [Virgibacillus kimchii]